ETFQVIVTGLLEFRTIQRDVFESDLLVVDQLVERESQRGDIVDDIPRTLLEGDENTGFVVVARAMDQERRRKKRLAATGRTTDERRASGRQTPECQIVEAVDACKGF